MATKPYLTKQAYVYGELRRKIQEGELRPGHRLSPQVVAEDFGVSPSPVREALQQLHSEELIELNPHKGAIVRGISVREAVWIADMRVILEPAAVALSVPHLPSEFLGDMRKLLGRMDAATSDQVSFTRLNQEFHGGIYRFCPNKRLVATIEQLQEDAHRFNTFERFPGRMPESQESHYRLLKALEEGDAQAAESETRLHRQQIANRLREWFDTSG